MKNCLRKLGLILIVIGVLMPLSARILRKLRIFDALFQVYADKKIDKAVADTNRGLGGRG